MRIFPVRSAYLANVPMLVSMVLAALWVWYSKNTMESSALFLGIIAGGLVDLDDGFTGRLRNLFFTLAYFSLAAGLVQWTYGHPLAFSLLMVLAAFSLTMLGAVDMRYRTIAFGTLLVMLYTVLTYAPHLPWYTNPLMLICGTCLFSLCTLVLHVLFPDRPVQDSLANAYATLAEYMLIKAQFFDPDEAEFLPEQEFKLAMQNTAVINGFNQCRAALFYRLRRQQRYRRTGVLLQYYLTAQNIHERISSRHVDYVAMSGKLAHSDLIYRIQRLIVLQAQACQQMSRCLHENQAYVFDDKLSRAGAGVQGAVALYVDEYGIDEDTLGWRQLISNVLVINELLQLLSQFRSEAVSEPAAENTIVGMDVDRLRDVIPALRMHLTLQSSVFRHAIRLAILTGVICLLVEGLQLKLGYWILLTGVIVCQPNYTATTTRLKQRIVGTLLGVPVGSIMPFFVPTLAGKLVVVVISTVLIFVFRLRRYSFSTFFITVQVLVGFAIIGIDTQAVMLPRFVDTILGAVLAWAAVSYLWPDWCYMTLGRIARQALVCDARYLEQVAQQLKAGQTDDVAYRAARRGAYELAATLSNTVADMSLQPDRYGRRVEEGKTLLLLNYVLISCISALGALRSQVDRMRSELQPEAIGLCCEIANSMATQMSEQADRSKFDAIWQEVQLQLEAGRLGNDTVMVEQVLWRQLLRIHQQLPLYLQALYQEQEEVSVQ